jgi:hypothetical protein
VVEEVVAKHLDGSPRLIVFEQRAQTGGGGIDARAEVANQVVEVVGVLVLASAQERERREHHEGSGATDPQLTGRILAEDGLSLDPDPAPILKRKLQSRRDDGCEVLLDIAEPAALIVGERWGNQEIHRDRSSPDPPSLPRRSPLVGWVGRELGGSQTLRQRVVATIGLVATYKPVDRTSATCSLLYSEARLGSSAMSTPGHELGSQAICGLG